MSNRRRNPLSAMNPVNGRLMTAIREVNEAKVREALKQGADVDHDFGAPIRAAAANGYLGILRILLEHDADIHAQSDEPLRTAIRKGLGETAKLLLEKGADANANDGEPLLDAVGAGKADLVTLLVAHKADVNVSGGLALRNAATQGDDVVVKTLLDAGADPFVMPVRVDTFMNGPGHVIVSDLIEQKATALRAALSFDLAAAPDARAHLLDAGAETGFAKAFRAGLGKQALARLSEKDTPLTATDINATDMHGRKIIQMAAEQGMLKSLFAENLWRGRLEDARAAWNAIPDNVMRAAQAKREDFAVIQAEHRQQALKQGAARKNKFKL